VIPGFSFYSKSDITGSYSRPTQEIFHQTEQIQPMKKDKAQRHCMVVHAYYPLGETRVQREAEALTENGIRVDLICLRGQGQPAREVINHVKIHRVPVRRRNWKGITGQFLEYLAFFLFSGMRLARLHIQNPYHIVQIHNLPDFLVFTAILPRIMGARIILDLHDLMPEFYASRFGIKHHAIWSRLVRRQEAISCRFAHHIITVTEFWRRSLIQRGIPVDKCSVVMNTADGRIFKPGRYSIRSGDKPGLTLLYHGNISHRNGIDLIIQAIAILKKEAPDIDLIIHGGGDYLEELSSLGHKLGVISRIHFSRDLVPVEELPLIITRADVGIVSIRSDVFTDGILPTKLMEYAALGMPAVAARTSTISDYFDESMVEFFEPGDADGLAEAVRRLYFDRRRLRELSDNILSFNRRYCWDKQKADYIAMIRDLAVRKKSH
jgi:glycosyltransferase involved in cell wall biosynthesis